MTVSRDPSASSGFASPGGDLRCLEILSRARCFRGLPARCLDALAEIARPRRFRKGDEILGLGEEARSLYLVVGGRVKMSKPLRNGRSLVLALFNPGDLFGAAAALAGGRCDAAMIALDSVVCLELPRGQVFELFERRPELVSELLPALTRQMVECSNCIVELSCFRVEKRFAQLLVKFADSVGVSDGGGGTLVPIPLSRQELADMAGTTIETSIRIMSRWSKERVVETRGDGFLIRDRSALEALAAD